ncbi:hypothetical protein BH11ARM2_BH11ARM2_09740 [soil metagenome]
MGYPFAICSGSFGGIRLDREAVGYYTLLLEQLGTVIDDPVHVFTDRVGVFSNRLDVIPARLGDYAGDF